MFQLNDRISAFEKLGRFMGQVSKRSNDSDLDVINQYFFPELQEAIKQAGLYNNWFTEDNVHFALSQWSKTLTEESIRTWIKKYQSDHFENESSRTIAVIMAGNIPLVGFHDFVSILLSGHKLMVKPSSDDSKLLPLLAQVLVAIDHRFADRIAFADGRIKGFDAIIATGSDNSSRYFEYYFSKYPHLIRKNRTSVSILSGDEDEATLEALGEDIFRYFGLGCRNVSKIYLPNGFDLDRLFKAFYRFRKVTDNNKYSNNYDYHRAVLMMEQEDFLENGFMIIKRSEKLQAPVSVVYVEEYEDLPLLLDKLRQNEEQLQCVVSEIPEFNDAVPFGSTQQPQLWDYADGIDTIRFLRSV